LVNVVTLQCLQEANHFAGSSQKSGQIPGTAAVFGQTCRKLVHGRGCLE